MLKRSVLAIFVMSAFVPVAHAGGVTVVGTVTKVGPASLEVRSANCEATSVTWTTTTKFRKLTMESQGLSWPAKVPRWQHGGMVDARSLKVGTAVRIETFPESPTTARTIWIK